MNLNSLSEIPAWEWPTGTGEFLRGILHNREAELSDRMRAADLAGNFVVVNDVLIMELLKIMVNDEESKDLRSIAALSFGPALEYSHVEGFDDPDEALISEVAFKRIKETLHKVYLDENAPKDVRRRVLEGSVRAPQDWHSDAINKAYASGDDEWISTAVFCMGYISGFDEQIVESLGSESWDIQYNAIRAAGEWRVREAWPLISSLLSSKETDRGLLIAAIEASVEINPLEASQILEQFTSSDDSEVAEAAAEAMSMQDLPSWLDDIE
ncbi:MAG: HEAT repeat domain-containing protein [Actinobacteria bacterium]|nr:HEAT repeat domain-containing protein [Actinomycetota bacterium]